MKPQVHVVLYKSDFANLDVWYGLLNKLNIPYGEEANWVEPEEVSLWAVKAETNKGPTS